MRCNSLKKIRSMPSCQDSCILYLQFSIVLEKNEKEKRNMKNWISWSDYPISNIALNEKREVMKKRTANNINLLRVCLKHCDAIQYSMCSKIFIVAYIVVAHMAMHGKYIFICTILRKIYSVSDKNRLTLQRVNSKNYKELGKRKWKRCCSFEFPFQIVQQFHETCDKSHTHFCIRIIQ